MIPEPTEIGLSYGVQYLDEIRLLLHAILIQEY